MYPDASRSRQALTKEYLIAKLCFDIAENESSKVRSLDSMFRSHADRLVEIGSKFITFRDRTPLFWPGIPGLYAQFLVKILSL